MKVFSDAVRKRYPVTGRLGWLAAGLLGAALLVPLSGCGGGSSANPSVGVSISPAATALAAGGAQTFTATVTGTILTSVTWSVEEGATGGTITSAGVYTAPTAAGTYHVIATSTADSTKTAAATVTVSASTAIGVSISPATTALALNGTQTFTATVTNTTNTSVTWSVEEGATGGTITSAGVYTAPTAAGTYHVIATSTADSTKTATATVTVTIQSGGSTVTVS